MFLQVLWDTVLPERSGISGFWDSLQKYPEPGRGKGRSRDTRFPGIPNLAPPSWTNAVFSYSSFTGDWMQSARVSLVPIYLQNSWHRLHRCGYQSDGEPSSWRTCASKPGHAPTAGWIRRHQGLTSVHLLLVQGQGSGWSTIAVSTDQEKIRVFFCMNEANI